MNRRVIGSLLSLSIVASATTTVWSQQGPLVKESTGLGKAHFGLRQLHEEYQAYLAQLGLKASSFKSSNFFGSIWIPDSGSIWIPDSHSAEPLDLSA